MSFPAKYVTFYCPHHPYQIIEEFHGDYSALIEAQLCMYKIRKNKVSIKKKKQICNLFKHVYATNHKIITLQ